MRKERSGKNLTWPILLLVRRLSPFRLFAKDWTIKVTVNGTETKFTLEGLLALPTIVVEYEGHIYRGVPLRDVLSLAAVNVERLESVEVIASDGYRKRYEQQLAKRYDTILAFEMDTKPFSEYEGMGNLRSVYPSGPSKMMVRMVKRLVVQLGT